MAPGIFEQSHHLCAIDNALMYFITNPEEMKDLIKYLTEYELRVAENVCDHLHPNALFHHDDWGSEINSFLRPEMFAEFFVDSYKEIYGYYKSRGAEFVFHHNDSYGANLIPYMIEMGIDVWQGTMESNNVKELLEEYKGKIAFMGARRCLAPMSSWLKLSTSSIAKCSGSPNRKLTMRACRFRSCSARLRSEKRGS